MNKFSSFLARLIESRPWWFVAVAIILTAGSIPGILMLKTETGFNMLVEPDAAIYQSNMRYQEQFGGESIIILLTGELDDTFSCENLEILDKFERDLSGNRYYLSLTSPATILNEAVIAAGNAMQEFQVQLQQAQEKAAEDARQAAEAIGLSKTEQEQAAEQAKAAVLQELQPQIEQMQQIGIPSLDNALFVNSILYNADGSISSNIQSLVPDNQHALVVIIPDGNLENGDALDAVGTIEDFLVENPLNGVTTTIIADAKLLEAISTSIGSNITILLALSVGVMAIILMLLFRVRWRLLSLILVGLSALWTFGLAGYLSIPVSMTTMAVLPILVGLGIDYSIQFHNRYQEELTKHPSTGEAIIHTITRMLPVVGIALLATVIGFITLYISEVPMIRDFGLTLAIGIALSYLAGLFLLHSIVYLGDKKIPIDKLSKASKEASGRIERALSHVGRLAINHTLPILIISLLFGIGGGIVDQWLPTNTDYEQLMPQDIPELEELREFREILGGSSTLNFLIEAEDVTAANVLTWLQEYQERELASHPELLSVRSPVTLITEVTGGIIPSDEQIDQIVNNTPPQYTSQFISADRESASLSFSFEYASLEDINTLLQMMTADAQPPDGVQISAVGSLALGASTVDAVISKRFLMNILCISAIFIVLLLVYRRLITAIFTVIPVGMVIAWSSLDMYLIGIPLNPLTSILGVLIIGIGTEFMVLLLGRYEEEKRKGESPREAMITAISRIGRAIVTTALTTLGGFGVLIASDFVMIRDFGIATVLGVLLCLISTIAVMPGLIVWIDERRSKKTAK